MLASSPEASGNRWGHVTFGWHLSLWGGGSNFPLVSPN